MKDPTYAIGVDIGGSSIRCGLVSRAGRLKKGSYHRRSVNSKGTADEILETFAGALATGLDRATRECLSLAGIGIGMCGPLDYDKGVVLIKGVDKYEALYGINLTDEFVRRLKLRPSTRIRFDIDAWAFARGEVWLGEGRGFERVLALTLGTGLGSGFVVNGRLLADGPGVPPPYGWIGGLPFRNGIMDDYISKRGIEQLYRTLSSAQRPTCPDVGQIARRARAGDAVCREVFLRFGEMLGAALLPIIDQFQAECLVLGGRISRSFPLFKAPLHHGLRQARSLQKVTASRSLNHSPIKGAARLFLDA